MATSMYHVRVLSVEGDRLTCRVTVVYHGENLTPSRTLAFRFIWEPWYDLGDGITTHLAKGEHVTPEEARLMARVAPLARELAGRDMNDLDWNQANADRFVRCVGVTEVVNYNKEDPYAHETEEPAQATYTIIATDPGWLAHLAAGMEWETTAFDDDAWFIPPAWRSPDVMAVARGIDASQDFSGMPVLADALQEASCDCADLLNHLRDPNARHVRGCWALDLVLGK